MTQRIRQFNSRQSNGRAVASAATVLALLVFFSPLAAFAQTRIVPPSNRYTVQDDVKVGQQYSAEVERQMPILRDRSVEDYVGRIGQRLVGSIPGEFQHREFQYRFRVVDASDINAFALPGGPMYVNRGMIEAARTEGEMAGVMSHELSHVALRHGTAQATKAGSARAQLPAIGGAILGSILGGTLGNVAATAGQLESARYITKYSREYETQADILGAQIMAAAGYDPQDLANMFRTIERQSGGGSRGPEWLSTHPNPGNRYQRISQEAALLRVSNSPIGNTREFSNVQARLRGMPRARSMEEIARTSGSRNGGGTRNGGGGTTNDRPRNGRVEQPSTRYRTYTGGDVFRVSVPDNWREVGSNGGNAVTYAPEGAYGDVQGQFVFTHGVQIGVDQASNRDLYQSSDAFVRGILQGNEYLRQQSRFQRGTVSGREGLKTVLAGESNVTGETEVVEIYTTLTRNGDLFYLIAVAPNSAYRNYQRAFDQIVRSVQVN